MVGRGSSACSGSIGAFAELALMWLAILATIVLFAPISPAAAILLLPYLAWVTFAGALNLTIWQMNRAVP